MKIGIRTQKRIEHILEMLYGEYTTEQKESLYDEMIGIYENSEIKERHTFDDFAWGYEIDLEQSQKQKKPSI